jgi:hypothetical protein
LIASSCGPSSIFGIFFKIFWISDALVMVSVYQAILKALLVPGHMTGTNDWSYTFK